MPKIINFPFAPARSAAMLETNLPQASLSDVRRSIEKLTADCAQNVFSRDGLIETAMERIEELNNQEVQQHVQICRMAESLGKLFIVKDFLAPDEMAELLNELGEEIFSCSHPMTKQLKEKLSRLKREWKHLLFLFVFPDASEFRKDSFQNNVFFKITETIKEAKFSNPKKAATLKNILNELVDQCKIAEEMFFGRKEHFNNLSEDVRLAAQKCLFTRCPGQTIEEVIQEDGGCEKIAAAIIEALMERVLHLDLAI